MSKLARVLLALLFTALVAVAALVYPWLARRDAWIGASWHYPWFLAGLAIVPLVWWWGTFGQDQRRPRLRIGTVMPLRTAPRGLRTRLKDVPGVLRAVALGLLIVAIARPVSILRDQRSDDKGIDIVLVMDLSGSMRAVFDADLRDLPNTPAPQKGKRLTRLDVAKVVIKDFIGRRKTDRIGAVVFGKSAFVLSPPTLDYHLLSQMVTKMTLNVIDGSATAIGDGLGTAVARMRRSDAQSKVVILLTDGDNNAGAISPDYATHLAKTVGCKVYTIQIGTDDEVDVEDGVDLFGQPRYVPHRFPVNPDLLRRIAKETGGDAYIATDARALANSMHAVLDQLEKTRFEASVAAYEDLFPFLLVPGVALLALDALLRAWLLREVSVNFAAPYWLFGTGVAGLVGLLLMLGALASARRVTRFGDPTRVRALLTADPSKRRAWKGVLLVAATALAFVAAARPQYGRGTRLIPATNVDVVIVLDYSKSMYARDVEPSRIFRAKVEVSRLIKELSGARFAAVAFAGEPMGFPLSADGAAIAQFLRQLDPNDMPVGGTAIGRALEAARDLLRRDPKSAEHKRIILLVTDGEDLEGHPESAAQAIGAEGTVIHVVQIGGRTPERIPEVGDNGEIINWRTDARGKPLTTQLTAEGEAQLSTIAAATGGTLVRAEKGTTGIDKIAGELRRQMQTEYGEKVETVYADVYFYPLGLAIVLLIIEVFLSDAPARKFQPRVPPPPPAGPRSRPGPPLRPVPVPAPNPGVNHGAHGAHGGATKRSLSISSVTPPCSPVVSVVNSGPAREPPLPAWKRFLALAFATACAMGALSSVTGGCSGWDPTSPFEHNAPDVDKAIAELDAGNPRTAEDILEEYLGTGPCTDAGIGLPDAVKLKPNGSFDLGLTLFYLAEGFGQPFGDEEEGLEGPNWKRNARLRNIEVNCALLIVLAIANDPSAPIELRARAHYLAGNLEFLRRRYEEAISHYDEALRLIPGMVLEAGGDDIGRDAAWNRAIALRRIPQVPIELRSLDGGEDEQDGDSGDKGDANDGSQPNSDDAGDAAGGGDADGSDAPSQNDNPDASNQEKTGDGSTPSDAQVDASGDAPADAGSDGAQPEPNPVGEPEPVSPDPKSDDRILDQLEQAPTYQEQEAKNRGTKRGRIRMEDK